jgi:peptidoglycan/LPS O-acetylase OafA/YrhL
VAFGWKDGEIKSIQILRGVAALSVVYVHCTVAKDYNFPCTGAFGVDIFFIISGFIIAFVVSRNTKHFMLKRIFRIEPMYILGTLMMILAVLLFPSLIRSITINGIIFIKSILFIPSAENSGYPILGPGWTLRFEMMFYLIMFICVLVVKDKRYVSWSCVGVIIIGLIILNIIKPENYILNYDKTGLFPEFIYGVILFHAYTKLKNRTTVINQPLKITLAVIIGIGSYVFMVYSDMVDMHISGNRNIFYGIPSLLIVGAFLAIENNIRDSKPMRFILEIGEASYVMYLFHYFIVIFFARVIFAKTIGGNSVFIIELLKLIIAYIATIGISIGIYEWVDKPIQKLLKRVLVKNGK